MDRSRVYVDFCDVGIFIGVPLGKGTPGDVIDCETVILKRWPRGTEGDEGGTMLLSDVLAAVEAGVAELEHRCCESSR